MRAFVSEVKIYIGNGGEKQMRTAEIKRKRLETDIVLKLNADGSGKSDINTGLDFLTTC